MVSLLKTINETLLVNGAKQVIAMPMDMTGHHVPFEGTTILEAPVPINKIELAIEYLKKNKESRKLSGYRLAELQPVPGVEINRRMWDRAKQRVG
jgi:hypothetical protein